MRSVILELYENLIHTLHNLHKKHLLQANSREILISFIFTVV